MASSRMGWNVTLSETGRDRILAALTSCRGESLITAVNLSRLGKPEGAKAHRAIAAEMARIGDSLRAQTALRPAHAVDTGLGAA